MYGSAQQLRSLSRRDRDVGHFAQYQKLFIISVRKEDAIIAAVIATPHSYYN